MGNVRQSVISRGLVDLQPCHTIVGVGLIDHPPITPDDRLRMLDVPVVVAGGGGGDKKGKQGMTRYHHCR